MFLLPSNVGIIKFQKVKNYISAFAISTQGFVKAVGIHRNMVLFPRLQQYKHFVIGGHAHFVIAVIKQLINPSITVSTTS